MTGDDHEGVDRESKINSQIAMINRELDRLEKINSMSLDQVRAKIKIAEDQLRNDLGTGTPGTADLGRYEYGVRWQPGSEVEWFGTLEHAKKGIRMAAKYGATEAVIMRNPLRWKEF